MNTDPNKALKEAGIPPDSELGKKVMAAFAKPKEPKEPKEEKPEPKPSQG